MQHGVTGFFVECARFRRRLSIVTLAVGLVFAGGLWLARVPGVRDAIDPTRFGFEGPDQYVRRIILQQYRGSGDILSDVGPIETSSARRGGGVRVEARTGHQPQPKGQVAGPGDENVERFLRYASRFV